MTGHQLGHRLSCLFYIFVISLGITACGDTTTHSTTSTTTKPDQTAEIIAVNAPLQYFTQQLAGELAEVSMIAPTEGDPAEWQPTIDEALRLQKAELLILNGAGYSKWLDKVAISPAKLINSSQGFSQDYIELSNQSTHSHGPTAEHSHGALAFTTWMDMSQAIQQAQVISQALEKRWPEEMPNIRQREAQLIAELSSLDQAYQQQAKRLAGKTLIYSHPVYQYFERQYNLPGHSLHWEPDQMPDEKQWHTLERLVTQTDNTLFIWEDDPQANIVNKMLALNLNFVVIRPASNLSDKDWLAEQQANIQRMKDCCQQQDKQ
ncbi:MAG TPA: zinc ABC transporter substrate-binding protein [Porticoccus sp.]|nr:zinc ABC transporter substrate-binding protein [Porticoccus sp.]